MKITKSKYVKHYQAWACKEKRKILFLDRKITLENISHLNEFFCGKILAKKFKSHEREIVIAESF